jgi:hypothetical protein
MHHEFRDMNKKACIAQAFLFQHEKNHQRSGQSFSVTGHASRLLQATWIWHFAILLPV